MGVFYSVLPGYCFALRGCSFSVASRVHGLDQGPHDQRGESPAGRDSKQQVALGEWQHLRWLTGQKLTIGKHLIGLWIHAHLWKC